MTEYLKMVPLPSWWHKWELKDLSISELFEELLSWNSDSKQIIPKYIIGTYFGAIVAIFNFFFIEVNNSSYPPNQSLAILAYI